jgi:hypothetical protein
VSRRWKPAAWCDEANSTRFTPASRAASNRLWTPMMLAGSTWAQALVSGSTGTPAMWTTVSIPAMAATRDGMSSRSAWMISSPCPADASGAMSARRIRP